MNKLLNFMNTTQNVEYITIPIQDILEARNPVYLVVNDLINSGAPVICDNRLNVYMTEDDVSFGKIMMIVNPDGSLTYVWDRDWVTRKDYE